MASRSLPVSVPDVPLACNCARLVGVAQVHARRVGQALCRLCVELLRDQRWEVITQEEEDQAHALLRAYRDGPLRRPAAEARAPGPDVVLARHPPHEPQPSPKVESDDSTSPSAH
jgi:hypothetical protein